MMSYMFGTKFWKAHRPPLWFWPWSNRVDIDALVEGGVKTFVCAAYVLEREMFADVWPLRLLTALYSPARYLATAPLDVLTREYLDLAEQMVEETRLRRGDIVEFARSYTDMQRITNEGKVCMLHAIEGAHHLNGNIDMVDELYERGVCQMIVPHLYPNEAGGCVNLTPGRNPGFKFGCFSEKYQSRAGLTPWGRDLVEKLLDVGILVDPTHGTLEFRRQVIEIVRNNSKKRPLIMSHTCVPSLSLEGPGPTPEEIRAIADTGGVIGIMMYTHREPGQGDSNGTEYVLNAIEHLVQHGGEAVVALGSDFDGTTDVPKELRSPRAYRDLRQVLLRKYTEAQVEKFLNGNAERVLKDGWGKP
jgi:membrane dipeptidase